MDPSTAGPVVWLLVVLTAAATLCLVVVVRWARFRRMTTPPGRARPFLLLVLLLREAPSDPVEKPEPGDPDAKHESPDS